jgi:hypothetical protein
LADVAVAIKLDDSLSLQADEVNDESADGMLSSELEAG